MARPLRWLSPKLSCMRGLHVTRAWSVGGKVFAWERPFSKAGIRRFGDATAPDGPILAVRVEDLGEKEAVLAAQPKAFFTMLSSRSPSRYCESDRLAGFAGAAISLT